MRICKENLVTKHIPTEDCLADFLTKIQAHPLFLRHRDYFVARVIDELKEFTSPSKDKSDISK